MPALRTWPAAAVLVLLIATSLPAQDQAAAGLTVIDGKGKEIVLKSWRLIGGTMPLDWLADNVPADKKNAPKPPEALVFREDKSTTYQNGILTLVPLRSLRAFDYDNDKKTVAVTVLTTDAKEQVLKGSTGFKDINKRTLKAEADLGALGVASVKYHGGALQDGIRGLRF